MFGLFKRAKKQAKDLDAMAKVLRLLEAEREMVLHDLGNQLEAKLHAMPREEALEWCRKFNQEVK